MYSKLYIPALLLAATFASCSDVVHYEEDAVDIFESNGAPVINAIYDISDTEGTAPLDGGSLNQMIRISGANLSHATEITFNGIPVDLTQVYATSANSYIKIPRVIPENVTNELVYTTELGTVRREFTVDIPSLRLEGLANEFCAAGESVQVNGEYFDLFGFGQEGTAASIRINGTTLEVDSLTENYMSIVIPENTPDNSLIEFAWTEVGGKQYSKKIPFRYKEYIFMPDLNAVGWWDSSVKKYITDGSQAGEPVSCYGNYFHLTGHFDQWGWNSFGGGFNWPGLDCRENPQDFVFKFEICSAASNPFYDSEGYGYQFGLNDSDLSPWNPSVGVSFNTYGEWRTVSIPLDKVSSKGLPEPNTWCNFVMVMQPNTSGGWDVNHSFANFRVEPAEF